MYRVTKIAAMLASILPVSLMAQTLQGVVQDKDGSAVANAEVEIEGIGKTVVTDDSGRFEVDGLPEGINELHIVAPGFAHLHQDINVTEQQDLSMTFTVQRSAIEVIDIVATPIHMSAMESAAPVSVLGGEALRRQQAATLGDSLEKIAGVHTNFHANVASTPVIRGLSGPRVLIAQNGLDVSDVSRVGPDHAVASEASTAQQIEVLRGPATLFYGSGAIGGVVNVVDGRIPLDNTTRGEWLLESNSVDEKKLASFNLTTGVKNIGFYLDGYWRESKDYEVPVAPEVEDAHDEHDHQDDHDSHDYVVSNSAEESKGFTLGTSVAFDGGYFGVAVERFEREYGIPGHSHGGDEEINVTADLEQTRIQLKGEHNLNNDYVNTVRLSGGFTEYEHAEIELGVAGTIFENDSSELKVDVLHKPFADWNGAVSFHFKRSKVAAEGEEAFTPPSEEETLALSIMEEKHFGDVLLQVGARVERVKLQAENVLLPELETHAHHDEEEEDHGHDHEHDHDHGDDISVTRVFSADHDFTPVSLSAGLVWDFTPGYNLGLSVSRSERAPSASELLSFGPHIGTRSYEVGALFALHEHEDEMHIELTEEVIDLETANNIDLTLRKTQGDFGFIFNLFYNKVGNYYYQVNTGLFAESGHDHDHGDEHDEHTDELPVYLFRTDDVVLHGFELQAAWQINDSFKTTFFSDYVRARLQDGGDLPRTSPMRFGTTLSYEQNNISAQLDITRYQEQNRIAAEETETDGYTLVDFNVSYDLPILEQDIQLYLKGKNLTDTEARVHTSFLKDIAPRPGRSIAVGIQGFF